MSSHSTASASVIDCFPDLQDVIVESEQLAQPATILEGAHVLGNPLDDNNDNVPDLVEAYDSDDEFSDKDNEDEEYDIPPPCHSHHEPPLHSSASTCLQPSAGVHVSDEDVVIGEVPEDVREAKASSCTEDEKKMGSGLPKAYQMTVKELAQNVASDTKSMYKSIIKKAEKFFQDHKILRPDEEFICKNP
ncbi:hypothetical protein Moror_3480 [Moniliophthora roreri MCA 2997]|uniref:Uncharacterized protein n=2 Tax=Moniliophthora roreri TaxID=221103 RepID=V2WPL1_MONRO|nr:hypothetical protein Moror_3480 [Moniliophthora roreri MCA 2997]